MALPKSRKDALALDAADELRAVRDGFIPEEGVGRPDSQCAALIRSWNKLKKWRDCR
jgi:hypothetical protein